MESISQAPARTSHGGMVPPWVAVAWIGLLAFLPISWLPTVSGSTLVVSRIVLAIVAVVGTVVYAQDRRLPNRLAGPVGLVLVLATSAFAIAQSDSGGLALRRLSEVVVAFGLLWAAYIYQRNAGGFVVVGMWAAAVLGVVSLVALILAGMNADLIAPGETELTGAIDRVAFGWSRTQWSAGVAMMLPFAVYGVMAAGRLSVRLAMIATVIALFASQVMTAGRSGIIASLLAVLVVVGVRWGWRGLVGAGMIGVAVVGALAVAFTERLRFDRLADDVPTDFSAGRVDLYRFGLEQIGEHPLTGSGFGVPRLPVNGSGLEIHNLWLRVGAEGGIVALVGLLAVIVDIGIRAAAAVTRVRRSAGPVAATEPAVFAAVLAAGMLISFFEPNVVLGSMTITGAWWASAGAIVAIESTPAQNGSGDG